MWVIMDSFDLSKTFFGCMNQFERIQNVSKENYLKLSNDQK